MKKQIFFIPILIITLFLTNVYAPNSKKLDVEFSVVLIYDCWGTIYNPVHNQCYGDPTITGSGFKINEQNASSQKIIAISHEMLYDEYRQNLLKNCDDNRFKGKLSYGDSVYVQSPVDSLGKFIYPNINGWWYVEDTKNKRYVNSVDFLQTLGDQSLYNYDKYWGGKFKNLKIYKIYYHDKK